MMKVNDVSKLSGVSVRTLHYYDEIGLLPPTTVTEAGYRLYDDMALARLQQILLFRELEFPLEEIRRILDAPGFDRKKALTQQMELLTLKKQHLQDLIVHAREMIAQGESVMKFDAFDTSKIDEYAKKAKEQWGDTAAYREFEKKTTGQSREEQKNAAEGLMALFAEFGALRNQPPEAKQPQGQVKKLQEYISAHFYTCTKEILSGLGQLYVAGGEMTDNIDAVAGDGGAAYVAEAISIYVEKDK